MERRGLRDRVAALLPWREVVVPWMVSRLVSAALIVATAPAGRAAAGTGAFSRWDGVWYLLIARSGYGHPPLGAVQSRWPFFPLLPGVIDVVQTFGVPGRGGAITVNHLAFLLALAGVWRIARRHTSDDASRLAVWALALFPAAFVFSMIYPSAIFLGTSVWAFVLVEEHHDVAAGVLAAAAALTRPNGVVVAIALAVGVAITASRRWRRVALVGGPALVAVAFWCALCWYWTGNPIVFLAAKDGWQEVNLVDFVRHPIGNPNVGLHLALGVAAGAVVLLRRRRLPSSWTLFTGLYLIPSLGLGIVGLARYTNECFPPFVAAGELLERTSAVTRRRLFLIAVGLQAASAWWVLHQAHVP
jgi:4-amino-4-deoxy-L-arabinose transferase-like glycosyltransferase